MADDHGHLEIDEAHARLATLEDRIQRLEARLEASERGAPGQPYYESGTVRPDLDDQTITP